MGRKFKLLATIIFCTSLVMSGCGSTAGDNAGKSGRSTDKNVINISLHQEPAKLDPRVSTVFVERHVFQSLYDKLVDIDSKGDIVPMLAEKWEISPDGLKYVLHLRKDVKFHDGTPFNAEAVKYNLDDYKTKGSNRANEIKAVRDITIVDPYTVELRLDKPYSPLLSILADRAGMMRSPDAVKKLGDKFMTNPVGSGPYMFKERVKGSKIVLEKNPTYWKKGYPQASNVVYHIINDANVALVNLKSGQLDMINRFPLNEVGNIKNDKTVKISNEAGLGHKGYMLNTTKPQFRDKRVRRAIANAIDREAIVKVALFGVGTPGRTGISPGSFAYDEELDKPVKPDIDECKRLLAEAGYPNGLKFTLSADMDPATIQIAQQVQNMLRKINVEMVIDKMEFGAMVAKGRKGEFEANTLGWSGRVDPDGNLYDWLYTGGNLNYMQYSNPEMDKLLDEARTVVDSVERREIYQKIMRLAQEDCPYIYLFHENNVYGLASEVQGFEANPDGMIRTVGLSKK